jgi:hypothetical protein
MPELDSCRDAQAGLCHPLINTGILFPNLNKLVTNFLPFS